MSVELVRCVAFGGVRIRLEHRGRRSQEIVEFLYRDTSDREDDPVQTTFQVTDDPSDGSITVRRETVTYYRGGSQADAARALQEATSYSLAAGSVGGLLFHAASVSLGGDALVLPGKSGTGKTTVTTGLVLRGFRYLTDELTFVPDDSLTLRVLPRPLNVKASGRTAVARIMESSQGWASLESPVATLLQPPAWQAGASSGGARLGVVVFPRFQQRGSVRLTPLTAAQCGLRLMACLLNARNLSDHGFSAVSEIARSIPSYELTYGDVEEVGPPLEDLARSAVEGRRPLDSR